MRQHVWICIAWTLFLSGCTTVISEQSRRLVDTAAGFSTIRETPEAYIGKHILVGGRIVAVRNSRSGGTLEIVQFEVDSSGIPLPSFRSHGRFIATTADFLEPLIYRQGMLITLVGALQRTVTERLDSMDYTYPVIALKEWYLWPGSEPGYSSMFPPPLPQYDPYNFGYGYEPFLPRPYIPYYRPR